MKIRIDASFWADPITESIEDESDCGLYVIRTQNDQEMRLSSQNRRSLGEEGWHSTPLHFVFQEEV